MSQGEETMVWIMLAALGVPILLVVGGLLGALWNRFRVRRTPDAFPCKMRTLSAKDGSGRWSRPTASARWVHDVLLVSEGLGLARSHSLPVRDVQGSVTGLSGVRLHGGEPISIHLSLDDGSVVEVAAPASAAPLLSGPFYAFEAIRVEGASP